MSEELKEEKIVSQNFDSKDIEENKTIATLAYLLFFLPWLAAKDSKYAMFHGRQAFVLFVLALIGWVVLQLLWGMMPWSFWGFLSILGSIWNLFILVLAVLGMVNAWNGKAEELPLIGHYAKKIKF